MEAPKFEWRNDTEDGSYAFVASVGDRYVGGQYPVGLSRAWVAEELVPIMACALWIDANKDAWPLPRAEPNLSPEELMELADLHMACDSDRGAYIEGAKEAYLSFAVDSA